MNNIMYPGYIERPTIGVNWVDNAAQVESVQLPPGQMALFLDKTGTQMFLRSRDTYNVYATKVFKLEEIQPVQPESPYVTRVELEEMFNKFLGGIKNEPLRSNDAEDAEPTTAAGQQSTALEQH